MSPINKSRARRCLSALRTYGSKYDTRLTLIDLLADARHWCDLHSECFTDIDQMAYEHYCAEQDGSNA